MYYRRAKSNVTGLTETVIGGSSPWYDHFTTTATANYNELGNSFPELLRLAELAKLTAIALVFQHRYRELRKVVLPPSTEVSDVSIFLSLLFSFIFQTIARILTASNLRSQVFGGIWPLVSDARIEETLDKALVKQGISLSHKHMVQNLADARRHIRQQLTEAENSQITAIADSLSQAFNISLGAISRTAISTYLANAYSNAEDALLNEIVSGNCIFLF